MRKIGVVLMTAALAASMATVVSADDISVRTSVGSGQVVFTETDEPANISAEELTEKVKESLKEMVEAGNVHGFLDAAANVSVTLAEDTQMEVKADAIGNLTKYEDTTAADLHYSFDGLGNSMSGDYQAYDWNADGKHFAAVSTDGENWSVTSAEAVSGMIDKAEDFMNSDEANQVSLECLQPVLYEEGGKKYYVCTYGTADILNTTNNIPGAASYSGLAEGIVGENAVSLVFVVNAETGAIRAISVDASNAEGTLPGALIGADLDVGYKCGDLYATILLDENAEAITIPEEVLNAPVNNSTDSILEDVEDAFAGFEELEDYDMTESFADVEGLEDFGDFELEDLGALDNSRAE